jgi:hypothetical protein
MLRVEMGQVLVPSCGKRGEAHLLWVEREEWEGLQF